jgi:diguanylate cyclase (GGDEF)-like protein
MSSWFADASIRNKLIVLVALSTTLALILAAVSLGAYEVVTYRRTLEQKLITVADIVGRNSTAALAFGDRTVARDILGALEAEPAIEAGAIFDTEGQPFATYTRAGSIASFPTTKPGEVGTRFEGTSIIVVLPIVLDNEAVGTVYVRAGLDALGTKMLVFGAVTLLIVVVCGLVALVMSAGLQRRFSQPILDLAETARRVTSDRNFSLRAGQAGRDEVGRLIEDFNGMLAEIERQDLQLRHQQEQLTVEVANRTADLQAANTQLTASVERVEHYADQIAQLTALGQLLQSCLTADEVYGVVPHAMQRLFPDGSGALTLVGGSGDVMETMAIWGTNPPHQGVFEPAECWAFRRGRPHLLSDLDSPVRCAHLTRGDGPVTFCVPMMAQGDTIGILQFSFAPGDEMDEVDDSGTPRSTRARIVVALSEQIALALANLRLREALRSQSVVDPLTGLYNRRYLETVLDRECRRAMRATRALTVLILDVDHFKEVNDTWGHDAGDLVLRDLAWLLRAHFRGDDIACRYGGEEFIVLLPEASTDAAYARAEQFRLNVHRLSIPYRNQSIGALTVSIGVASLPTHGVAPEDLIAAADRALYEAKTGGRDRTVCASADAPMTTMRGSR